MCDTIWLSRKIWGLEHGGPGQCAPHIRQCGCVCVLFPAPAARRGTVRSGTECRDCATGLGGAAHAGRSIPRCLSCRTQNSPCRTSLPAGAHPRTPAPHAHFFGAPGLHDNKRLQLGEHSVTFSFVDVYGSFQVDEPGGGGGRGGGSAGGGAGGGGRHGLAPLSSLAATGGFNDGRATAKRRPCYSLLKLCERAASSEFLLLSFHTARQVR